MPTVKHDGPVTEIGNLSPGELKGELERLRQEGYVEVQVVFKDRLQPKQFFKRQTRAGSPAEEKWTICKRTN